jgi:MFS family permease
MLMQHVSGDAFMNWGWRIPFLASIVLIALGVYLRTHMSESEEFASAMREEKAEKAPLIEVLRKHPKEVLMVFGLRLGEGAASWIFFAFSIAYGKFLGLSDTFVLGALTCSMVAMIPITLFAGHLTDLVGRKPVYIAASLAIVVLAYPFFLLLDTKDPVLVVTAFFLANTFIVGLLEGAQPALINELLPARLRYSGIGIGREVASVLGGGLAPVIATALLANYRSGLPIAIYLAAMGAVTLITALLTPETYPAAVRKKDRQLRRAVTQQATVLNT